MFQIGILLLVVFGFVAIPAAAGDTQINPPGFGPSYISDTIPDRLLPGYSYPVFVTFRNTGLFTWRNEIRRFGLLYEGDMKTVVAIPSFVEIPDGMNISPGKDVVFGLTLLPVGLPGTYQLPFSVAVRSAVGDQKITETHVHQVSIVPTDGISSPRTGSVLIESPSPDLTVSLDRIDQGKVPAILPDLKPGKYLVLVKNTTFERIYPVEVEPGVMTRLYIQNEKSPPWVVKRKVGPVSDGTLIGYIEANVPLIGVILGIIGVCIGAIVHGVRKRRREEDELKEKESSETETPEGRLKEKLEEEKKLLDKTHEHPPIFEAASPVSYSGSGSAGPAPKPNPNVWAGSNKISPLYLDEIAKKSAEERQTGASGLQHAPDLSLRLESLDTKPGSATANIGIANRSPFPVKVEGQDIHAGGFGVHPVQLKEPVDDSPDVTLSLHIFAEGSEFLRSFSIPYNRGIALLARGVIGKAYEYFRALLDRYPENTAALYEQAGILLGWGLEEEAVAVLEELLRLDPTDEKALEALEKIRRARSDREEKRKPPVKPDIAGYPDELSDRYTPIKLLGEDPFATIILVRRNDNGELRALKIPHATEAVASSLFTEISLLYQLRHPYVLRMFRAEFQPRVFLELEYVSGGWYDGVQRMTLADLPVPLPEPDWLPLIEKIAEGLAYLHRQGVRHYHLSPRYILLDEPMVPKISGLIRESLRHAGGSGDKEQSFIRSPEQIDPDFFGKPGKRTDLFQMGVIWYWLATGTEYTLASRDQPDVITNRLSGFNRSYEKYDPLLAKLIATFKKDRYSSVELFIEDLTTLLSEEEAAEEDGDDRGSPY